MCDSSYKCEVDDLSEILIKCIEKILMSSKYSPTNKLLNDYKAVTDDYCFKSNQINDDVIISHLSR